MSTVELKSSLHHLIDLIDDDAVLQAYVTLLSREVNHQKDFWDELTEDQKQKIDRGLADLNEGKKKSLSEVFKKYQ
ncbi:hypothetical protein [Larkinella soli]|uniref:hypothetical protein n=1 Tax=Larkinella soli TaxID=1770527 RepID=UPI000FFB5A37|nr:hypothetical protein [Larkinella soli]